MRQIVLAALGEKKAARFENFARNFELEVSAVFLSVAL